MMVSACNGLSGQVRAEKISPVLSFSPQTTPAIHVGNTGLPLQLRIDGPERGVIAGSEDLTGEAKIFTADQLADFIAEGINSQIGRKDNMINELLLSEFDEEAKKTRAML